MPKNNPAAPRYSEGNVGRRKPDLLRYSGHHHRSRSIRTVIIAADVIARDVSLLYPLGGRLQAKPLVDIVRGIGCENHGRPFKDQTRLA
jgi:hypothetical protein